MPMTIHLVPGVLASSRKVYGLIVLGDMCVRPAQSCDLGDCGGLYSAGPSAPERRWQHWLRYQPSLSA